MRWLLFMQDSIPDTFQEYQCFKFLVRILSQFEIYENFHDSFAQLSSYRGRCHQLIFFTLVTFLSQLQFHSSRSNRLCILLSFSHSSSHFSHIWLTLFFLKNTYLNFEMDLFNLIFNFSKKNKDAKV